MSINTWLLITLAAFDAILVAVFFFWTRRRPPVSRTDLTVIAMGLGGFVAQALICFSGAFLVIQLAAIASVFAVSACARRKPASSAPQE